MDLKLDHRRQEIIDRLVEAGTVTVDELASQFSVSKMTIHRDLDELAQGGFLRKVRGGAALNSGGEIESDYALRQMLGGEEKQRIAAAAAAMVEPGQTVMIDAGSTSGGVAKHLLNVRPLTVISNNLSVIEELAGAGGVNLIALGGQYSKKFHGFFGILAEQSLKVLRADIAFLSTTAIHGASAFHQDQEVVQYKRLMMEAADRRYLLADHRKFGRPALHFLTELSAFDAVLTGRRPAQASLDALRDAGVVLKGAD